MKLTLYVDGASKGNPGRASVGIVVLDGGGKVVSEKGQTIGRATNNQAEYMALLRGLDEVRRVAEGDPREIKLVVRSDSELLCRQLRGEYRVRNKVLMRLSRRVREKLMMFGSFSVDCIPREQNRLADRLAQKALSDRVHRSTFSLDEKVKS